MNEFGLYLEELINFALQRGIMKERGKENSYRGPLEIITTEKGSIMKYHCSDNKIRYFKLKLGV